MSTRKGTASAILSAESWTSRDRRAVGRLDAVPPAERRPEALGDASFRLYDV